MELKQRVCDLDLKPSIRDRTPWHCKGRKFGRVSWNFAKMVTLVLKNLDEQKSQIVKKTILNDFSFFFSFLLRLPKWIYWNEFEKKHFWFGKTFRDLFSSLIVFRFNPSHFWRKNWFRCWDSNLSDSECF